MTPSCFFAVRPYLITLQGEYIHPLFTIADTHPTMSESRPGTEPSETGPLDYVLSPSTPTDVLSRRSPSSHDEIAPTRISSRLRKEEVYDFNRPVLLHGGIEEKSVAADDVLLGLGFALCDGDALWW